MARKSAPGGSTVARHICRIIVERRKTTCNTAESRPIAISTCRGCRRTCSSPRRARELKERMPYVEDGPQGPHWVAKNGANFGLNERRRPGRRAVRPRPEPPGRQDGRDRPVRGRQEGTSAAAATRICGSRTWTATASTPRSSTASSAPPRGSTTAKPPNEMLRIYNDFLQGFLQPLSRPRDRPRLPALWRHRRRGQGGPPRRQDGHQGPRAVLLVGHGADVAPDLGAAVEGGRTTCNCRCTSTPSRRLAASAREGAAGQVRRAAHVHRRRRLPDEPDQHHRRADRRRRARALPEPPRRRSARAASAGCPTRSTAWISSTRTASAT